MPTGISKYKRGCAIRVKDDNMAQARAITDASEYAMRYESCSSPLELVLSAHIASLHCDEPLPTAGNLTAFTPAHSNRMNIKGTLNTKFGCS
jgi:hypothetical protein